MEGVRSGRYSKGDLAFLKSGIDRIGDLEEFQKAYKEFKETHSEDNTKDIHELNKEFKKVFDIPDMISIPGDLNN